MRILHTADWHLGRLFHQLHLTDDQAYVLDQMVTLVKDERPDVVVIAGDIYDRSVPPPEAVALLDDTISRLVLDCKTRVVLIAGNHDSPQRLNFASRLLADRGVYVAGTCAAQATTVVLHDDTGPIYLYALPFAEPSVVRGQFACDTVNDHETAMRCRLDTIRQQHPVGTRSLLISHAFVAGGVTSDESERPLSVGGSAAVPVELFADFDYIALGHLHRPQTMMGGRLRYAGSLLKYSFAEADQPKSVSLVDMNAHGICTVKEFSFTPRHDVRCISGCLLQLLNEPDNRFSRDDYLEVTLLDSGPMLDAMGRLREVYPNVLHIERPIFSSTNSVPGVSGDHRALEITELFARFYNTVTETEISDDCARAFAKVADTLQQVDREALTV